MLVTSWQLESARVSRNIVIWKIKNLMKLESARGNGTSMISIIMSSGNRILGFREILDYQYKIAFNMVPRNWLLVRAIESARQRLRQYDKFPPNGLVLYTGTIITDDGEEKEVTIDFEPFTPIYRSLCRCDNKFHTEALNELLESDDKFGFMVMDGNSIPFGMLRGNTREVLYKFTVSIPWRGSQSAPCFKRWYYVRETAELAKKFYFNTNTSQPNVSGLILAGTADSLTADFMTELSQSGMFDLRLKKKILNVVDVSHGGESGFDQAIGRSAEILPNVQFIQEKLLIRKYFEEISQDTGKYVFGIDDTLKILEMGAIKTLIVWENLDITRYILKNSMTGEIVIKHLSKEQEADQSNFRDEDTSAELVFRDKMPLLQWFANEYKKFGCILEFVTNKSQEVSQFCQGFGGIGGILRYQLDVRSSDELSDNGGQAYDDSD